VLLLESEGKTFLREYGVVTPRGTVVRDPAAAEVAARTLGPPVMLKAQVPSGRRGQAGGVVKGETVEEVARAARQLLDSTIRGHRVEALLVEEWIDVKHEYYVAVTLDGVEMLALLGTQGGVDVEAFFSNDRSAFEVISVDPLFGLQGYQVRAALERLEVRPDLWVSLTEVVTRLVDAFRGLDATLVEVNPLAEIGGNGLMALDARVMVDDGALFRQPRLREIHTQRVPASEVERRLRELEIQWVPLGGEVGLLSSGAGAGVTILDWIDLEGARPAGFMDIDYAILAGRSEEAMRLALEMLGGDPRVRSILVNFTSCGVQVDALARVLVAVLRDVGDDLSKPCFIHIQGNRGAEAHKIVREAGYLLCDTLGEAVREACRAARPEGARA